MTGLLMCYTHACIALDTIVTLVPKICAAVQFIKVEFKPDAARREGFQAALLAHADLVP